MLKELKNKSTVTARIYQALKSGRKWMNTYDLSSASATINTATHVSKLRKHLDCMKTAGLANETLEHKQEGNTHLYRIIGGSGR
jgi:hypothetical protein